MKRAFTLLELVIVVAIIAVGAAFLWPVFARLNSPKREGSCLANLKQIGLGFIQYTQDYNDKFPFAHATPTMGWADALQPYLKSRSVFWCPMTPTLTAPGNDNFYNRRLSGVAASKVSTPSLTILAGDGEANAPTWNLWAKSPADAATNSTSPSQRHDGTANYLFADGYVKALKPSSISSTFAAPTSRATFAFR
ncbi:hypothetical protein IAD21_03424 [Abditibacteriota bacterium]|nr:hypothetical protein IAD21_03424 [Abditibacteriota bacterium]